MELGEALAARADLQERLRASAVVHEGDAPPEAPARLRARREGG
jgi:hypothetical protein